MMTVIPKNFMKIRHSPILMQTIGQCVMYEGTLLPISFISSVNKELLRIAYAMANKTMLGLLQNHNSA